MDHNPNIVLCDYFTKKKNDTFPALIAIKKKKNQVEKKPLKR
jgi:hypothetical protein